MNSKKDGLDLSEEYFNEKKNDNKNKEDASVIFFIFGLLILIGISFLGAGVEPIVIHCMFAITGIIYALVRRKMAQRKREETSLVKIVLDDYLLTKNASLSLLSIIYTIVQGASFFVSISLMIVSIFSLTNKYGGSSAFVGNFAGSILLLVGLLIFRLFIEFLATTLRFGEDFSQLKDDFKKYSKNNSRDPNF